MKWTLFAAAFVVGLLGVPETKTSSSAKADWIWPADCTVQEVFRNTAPLAEQVFIRCSNAAQVGANLVSYYAVNGSSSAANHFVDLATAAILLGKKLRFFVDTNFAGSGDCNASNCRMAMQIILLK